MLQSRCFYALATFLLRWKQCLGREDEQETTGHRCDVPRTVIFVQSSPHTNMNPCMQLFIIFGVAFCIFLLGKNQMSSTLRHDRSLSGSRMMSLPALLFFSAEVAQRSPSQVGGSLPFTTGVSVGCGAGNLVVT